MADSEDVELSARCAVLKLNAEALQRDSLLLANHLAARAAEQVRQDAKRKEQKESDERALACERDALLSQLAAERAAFEAEKELAHDVSTAAEDMVQLNVGGSIFTMRRAVLERAPGFFGALFSGRHAVARDVHGSVVIDRDGTHFSHILAYLRDESAKAAPAPAPAPAVPAGATGGVFTFGPGLSDQGLSKLTPSQKTALATEADYFGLDGLQRILEGTDYTRALTPSDAKLREAENGRRATWALGALNSHLEEGTNRGGCGSGGSPVPLQSEEGSQMGTFSPPFPISADNPFATVFSSPLASSPALASAPYQSPPTEGLKAARTPKRRAEAQRPGLEQPSPRYTVMSSLGHGGPLESSLLDATSSAGPWMGTICLCTASLKEARAADAAWTRTLLGVDVRSLHPIRRVDNNVTAIEMPYPRVFDAYASHFSAARIAAPSMLVTSLDTFEANLERVFPNVLGRLKRVPCTADCGWVLAGGGVLRALLRDEPRIFREARDTSQQSDLDIFIYCPSSKGGRDRSGKADAAASSSSTSASATATEDARLETEERENDETRRSKKATKMAKAIWDALAVEEDSEWIISRGRHVINMRRGSHPPIQIILRLYESPSEVLHGFDIDAACLAYTPSLGGRVWALPRAIRALRHGINLLNPLHGEESPCPSS